MAKKTVSSQQGQANADAIRQLWRAENASLKRLERLERTDVLRHGTKKETFQVEADKLGINVDTVAKMRRLAEQYTLEQIEVLCEKIILHASTFGPSHFLILLRMQNRKQRHILGRQAIRDCWSTSQLERAIQAAKAAEGKSRSQGSGRKPKVPDDPMEALIALQALCKKFNNWCEVALGQLPQDVQLPVKRATRVMAELLTAVGGHLPDVQQPGNEMMASQNHF